MPRKKKEEKQDERKYAFRFEEESPMSRKRRDMAVDMLKYVKDDIESTISQVEELSICVGDDDDMTDIVVGIDQAFKGAERLMHRLKTYKCVPESEDAYFADEYADEDEDDE